MIIKIFEEEDRFIDTDWTLRECFNQLNKQKHVSPSLTGGKDIIVSWWKTGLLFNAEYGLIFYDVEFEERKDNAIMTKVSLHYSTEYETRHGVLKETEVLYER